MLIESLRSKLIEYQKSRSEIEVSTLRLLISEIKNKEISLKVENKEISSDDIFRIFKKQVKNRNETIPMYEKAGRIDTAEKEKKEVVFIENLMKEYFPMKFQINKEDLKKGFVNITFVGDSEMLELNKKYRNKDYPTDVLSFGIHEKNEEGKYYIGDVVVNVDQAERQASEYGNNLEQELSELAGHGILHLLGIHHEHDDE